MIEKLTLLLNGKEYELNDDFKQAIENRARNAFRENERLDLWWEENERGDPVLNIETFGKQVPWDCLEQLKFEVQEVEEGDDANSDDAETTDLDGGNGVKSVPKDEVNLDTDPTAGDEGSSPPENDTTFMLTHPSDHRIPQPEEDDPEKIPADPEEIPEDPSLVAWVPDNGTTECWSTGKALVPQTMFLEWNVQVKADEAGDDATKEVVGDDGHVEEVRRTNSHDRWERLCEMYDCEVVAEKQPTDEPPSDEQGDSSYSGKEPDETLDGKYGGQNWNV